MLPNCSSITTMSLNNSTKENCLEPIFCQPVYKVVRTVNGLEKKKRKGKNSQCKIFTNRVAYFPNNFTKKKKRVCVLLLIGPFSRGCLPFFLDDLLSMLTLFAPPSVGALTSSLSTFGWVLASREGPALL